ncbi:MAG: 30S ribosomal protein S3 [Oscillospiraceae bacterium]|jgi:small subunit ribosomal protein S3|nr:30S ribosomal protein S3 [Oscillospiraceae bacterium]
MGQKINPHGMRVGIYRDWSSRWFADKKGIATFIIQDNALRKFIKKEISNAGVPKIEIERSGDRIKIFVHCARPGLVIGRAGSGIEKLRSGCEKLTKKSVSINIVEVKRPDTNAQLVSESVAQQIEKRISFRRAMKQAIGRSMRSGVNGIKIRVGGRLGGADIARAEHFHEGSIPLQTIRADIDYGFAEAFTTYGMIGVKTWLYKGEIFKENQVKQAKIEQGKGEENVNAEKK